MTPEMLTQAGGASSRGIFGSITAPQIISSLKAEELPGKLVDRGIKLLVVGAGLYALINLILAGYAFISAGDDPKKVAGAWAKIWQTMLGLAVAAGAFILAGIFGKLLFDNPLFLLTPAIQPL